MTQIFAWLLTALGNQQVPWLGAHFWALVLPSSLPLQPTLLGANPPGTLVVETHQHTTFLSLTFFRLLYPSLNF